MTPEAKNIYLQDYPAMVPLLNTAKNFDGIAVMPNFFDVLEINREDFIKSRRTQFQFEGDEWLVSNM